MPHVREYVGQYLFITNEAYAIQKHMKHNYPYLIKEDNLNNSTHFVFNLNNNVTYIDVADRLQENKIRIEKKIQANDYCIVLDTENVRNYRNGESIGKLVQFEETRIEKYYRSEGQGLHGVSCTCIGNTYATNYRFGDLRLATLQEVAANGLTLQNTENEIPVRFTPQVGDVCKYLGDSLNNYLVKGNFYTIEKYEIHWYFIGDTNPYAVDWFQGSRGAEPQFLKLIAQDSKIRIGDEVRCICNDGSPHINRFGRGAGWEEGKVFIVDSISNKPNDILWDSDGTYGVYKWFVEKTNINKSVIKEVPKINLIEDKIQWSPKNKDQKFTYIQEQLVKCMLYKPEHLRKYIAKSNNPGYAARFVKSLFPDRVGIEFDTAGRDDNILNWLRQEMAKSVKFAVGKHSKGNKEYLWVDNSGNISNNKTYNNELRFSTTSIFQLKTLKELCTRLNNSSVVDPCKDGGLHIHIDLQGVVGISKKQKRTSNEGGIIKKRASEFRNYRNYMYAVFDIPSKNTIEGTNIRSTTKKKRNNMEVIFKRVCIHRNHPTAEYRLANTTFSYDKLIRYIIFCHLMTETLKKPGKKFDKALFEKMMLV